MANALVYNPFFGTLDYVGTGGGGGSITGGGTATEVAFFTAATAIGSDAGLFYLPVSGGGPRLGIGTITPTSAFHIAGNALVGSATEAANDTAAQTARFIMLRSRGTLALPTPAQSGTILGQLLWAGYDGGTPGIYPSTTASIQGIADETFSNAGGTPGKYGGHLRFFTTPIGTQGSLERLRIADDGSLLVGTTATIAGSRAVITGGALHVLGGNALRLQGAGAGFSSFVDPSHAANIAYTLPSAQASAAGQMLANDGAGVLSWIAAPSTVPSGPAGGDLSGTYPNPAVAKINGVLLGATTATDGTLLVGDTASSSWISRTLSNDATLSNTGVLTLVNTGPGAITRGTATRSPTLTIDTKGRVTALSDNAITLAGDVTGNVTAAVVAKINGSTLGTTSALDGRILIAETSSASWISRIVSGDATLGSTGTLALVNTGPGITGPIGDATHTPTISIDAKGRVTALSATLITGVVPAAHNFLDPAVHNNTVLGTPVRGDTIVANATPAWTKLALGGTGALLRSTGADLAYSAFTMGAVFNQGDIPVALVANTITGFAKDTTVGQTRYVSNSGASNNPLWAQVNLANGVAGTLGVGNGGTGFSTYTAGDLLYATGAATLAKLAIGAANQVLQVIGGLPTWQTAAGATIKVSEDAGATTIVDTLDFTEPDATLVTFPVATTARVALSAYPLKAGRPGTGNDTTLSTTATGTLAGSAAVGQNLLLLGSTNPSTAGGNSFPAVRIGSNVTNVGASLSGVLALDANYIFNNAGGRLYGLEFGSQAGVPSTWTWTVANVNSHFLFLFDPVFTISPAGTSRNIGAFNLLLNQAVTDSLNATLTIGALRLVNNAFNTSSSGTGHTVVTEMTDLLSQPNLGVATDQVTARRGLWFRNPQGVGRQLTTIGLDAEEQTSAVAFTLAAAVRSAITDAGNATKMFLQDTGGARSEFAGMFTRYKNVPTVGWGIPGINGYNRTVGASGAVASAATYTVGAADGTFSVSGNVLVTTSTSHSFSLQVDYTDEGGTARTATLNVQQLGGTLITTITNLTGAGPYEGIPLHIRAKAATAITVKTTGTFTTVTYNVEGVIVQVA